MAKTLESLFTSALTATVVADLLSPQPPIFGIITIAQDNVVQPLGQTVVTLNWALPVLNERISGELLGVATGSSQILEAAFDPITTPIHELYEVTDQNPGGGGSTTLASMVVVGDNKIAVSDPSNFSPGEVIQIKEGLIEEYAVIGSIASSVLTLEEQLRQTFTTSATVKEVTTALKTEIVDYTVDLTLGRFTLGSGQFTASNPVFLQYTTTLQDFDHLELYRVPVGSAAAPTSGKTYITRDDVIGSAGFELIDDDISVSDISFVSQLATSKNGETWFYYLFAVDDEIISNASRAAVVPVETLPSIPQNLQTVAGDLAVTLLWDALPVGSDVNTDGFNIYRNDGLELSKPNLKKLNSVLVPKGINEFDDSAANGVNRVGTGVVPAPANGSIFTYIIESEDTITDWVTGTANESDGVAEVLTASKTV